MLDEPTNDLDVETLDLLEELLADHPGTLLLVSHDRDFIDRLVTSTIVFDAPGRVREYAGGYSDWLRQRPATPSAKTEAAAPRPRPEPRSPAFPAKLQRELDRLPERIAALGREIGNVETALADPGFYARDARAFADASARLAHLRAEIAALEDRWLELETQREAERC